jgi:cyclopropane-fatty-acyl-phospholipid synthase
MSLLSLEHSRAAYRADFVLHGTAVVMMAALLWMRGPPGHVLALAALTLAGLAGWSALEYALHRFVLHGLQPFKRWHGEHHRRPTALIYTPTVMSAALIVTLVFLPAWALTDLWGACALTLGVTTGYLAYATMHHALHHWHADFTWLRRRKRWHAMHHRVGQSACYGVTSPFWDHVFGSTASRRRSEPLPVEEPS